MLREKDGIITVYGNPWNGKEEYGSNISAPLGGIFILKRSTENRTAVVPPFEALKSLLAQTMRPTDKERDWNNELYFHCSCMYPLYNRIHIILYQNHSKAEFHLIDFELKYKLKALVKVVKLSAKQGGRRIWKIYLKNHSTLH